MAATFLATCMPATFAARAGPRDGGGYNGPVNDLEHELRRVVRGSVRFDPASLLLYSTDASMYQVEPLGVVTPRDPDDVMAAFDVARHQQVALLPRVQPGLVQDELNHHVRGLGLL